MNDQRRKNLRTLPNIPYEIVNIHYRHKIHGNSINNGLHSGTKPNNNGSYYEGSSYFGVNSNATITCESPHPVSQFITASGGEHQI